MQTHYLYTLFPRGTNVQARPGFNSTQLFTDEHWIDCTPVRRGFLGLYYVSVQPYLFSAGEPSIHNF